MKITSGGLSKSLVNYSSTNIHDFVSVSLYNVCVVCTVCNKESFGGSKHRKSSQCVSGTNLQHNWNIGVVAESGRGDEAENSIKTRFWRALDVKELDFKSEGRQELV